LNWPCKKLEASSRNSRQGLSWLAVVLQDPKSAGANSMTTENSEVKALSEGFCLKAD